MIYKDLERVSSVWDMIRTHIVMAIEWITLKVDTGKQVQGDTPEAWEAQYEVLKKEVVEIVEKWHPNCVIIRGHFTKLGEPPKVGFEGSNETPLKGVTRDSGLSYTPFS